MSKVVSKQKVSSECRNKNYLVMDPSEVTTARARALSPSLTHAHTHRKEKERRRVIISRATAMTDHSTPPRRRRGLRGGVGGIGTSTLRSSSSSVFTLAIVTLFLALLTAPSGADGAPSDFQYESRNNLNMMREDVNMKAEFLKHHMMGGIAPPEPTVAGLPISANI